LFFNHSVRVAVIGESITARWFAYVGPEYGQVKQFTASLVRRVIGVMLSRDVEIGCRPYATVVSSSCPPVWTLPAVQLEWFDNIIGRGSNSRCIMVFIITSTGIWLTIKKWWSGGWLFMVPFNS